VNNGIASIECLLSGSTDGNGIKTHPGAAEVEAEAEAAAGAAAGAAGAGAGAAAALEVSVAIGSPEES